MYEAKELGVSVIDLTGGEPTMHPNFTHILKIASDLGFEKINISTNGLELIQKDILEVISADSIHCCISLDGATKQTVDNVRGQGVFEKSLKVFDELRTNRISYSFRFSINKLNASEIKEILQFSNNYNVKADIELTQLIGNATEEIMIGGNEVKCIAKQFRKMKAELLLDVNESFTSSVPCDGGFSDLLSVNTQNTGVVCLMMTHNNHYSTTENVSLKKMWDEIQGLKKKLREFSPIFDKCFECQYYAHCSSGCWVTANKRGCLKI